MKVKLSRRWAMHRAGQSVEVDDVQGEWLIQHNYAESTGDVRAPEQPAAAEGAHGADPLAGADATRLRPSMGRPTRDPERNYADQAAGSSPTYRPGYTAEHADREGEAGRNYVAPGTESADDGPQATKRPARRRSKSGS